MSSGKKRSQARPTTSSTSTRPTLLLRESVEPARWSPSTKSSSSGMTHSLAPLGQGRLVLAADRIVVRVGGLIDTGAIDPDGPITDIDLLAGHADDALDVRGRVAVSVGMEDDDVATRIVIEPRCDLVDEQVLALLQRIDHGALLHAEGLHDEGGDDQVQDHRQADGRDDLDDRVDGLRPLSRRFCFLDRRVVLVQAGIGLRGAAHVAEQGADGGDDRGEQRNLVDHAAVVAMFTAVPALLRVFNFMVMRAMDVKTVFRHFRLLRYCDR